MNKNNESHPMKVAIILISESSLPIALVNNGDEVIVPAPYWVHER